MENGIGKRKVVSISKEDRKREREIVTARMEILTALDTVKFICLSLLRDLKLIAEKYFATKRKVEGLEMFNLKEYEEYKGRMATKQKQQGPQLMPNEPETKLRGIALYSQLYKDEAPLNKAVEEFTKAFEEEKINLMELRSKSMRLARECEEIWILGKIIMDLGPLYLSPTPDSLESIKEFEKNLEKILEQIPKNEAG